MWHVQNFTIQSISTLCKKVFMLSCKFRIQKKAKKSVNLCKTFFSPEDASPENSLSLKGKLGVLLSPPCYSFQPNFQEQNNSWIITITVMTLRDAILNFTICSLCLDLTHTGIFTREERTMSNMYNMADSDPVLPSGFKRQFNYEFWRSWNHSYSSFTSEQATTDWIAISRGLA